MTNYVFITAVNSQSLLIFITNNLRIQIEIGGILIRRHVRGEIHIVNVILSNRAIIRKVYLTICFTIKYP